MIPTSAEFADAAEALTGTRWRRHGRSADIGLDCAGLPICALAKLGVTVSDTRDYDALMPSPDLLWRFCRENGKEMSHEDSGEGRIGICSWRPGDVARHLVVMLAGRRIAHVHAPSRAVVVPSGWVDGRLAAVFRVNGINYGEPWSR